MTPEALALVQRFEGLRLEAAPLEGGGFAIGHGHVSAADPGRTISPAEARALLVFDLSRVAAAIEPLVLAPTSAAQFDALLSFAFAIGVEAFAASTPLKRLNAGAYLDAAAALELWRCAVVAGEPQVVDALVRRRAVEKARFLDPPDGFAAVPSAVLRAREDGVVRDAAERLRDGRRVRTADGDEPAPSAALAVVAALSARLDRLMAPVEPPAPSVAPPPEPVVEPEPEPPPFVASQPTPEPPTVAGPAVEPPVEPPPAVDPAPPPTLAQAEPAFTRPSRPPEAEPPPPSPRVSPPSLRGPALLLGLIGLVLFGWAVVKTYQAPSLMWLALGLLGVAAMVPASLSLIGPRRPADD